MATKSELSLFSKLNTLPADKSLLTGYNFMQLSESNERLFLIHSFLFFELLQKMPDVIVVKHDCKSI